MKKAKRTLAIALVIFMFIAAFGGCGTTTTNDTASGDTTDTADTADTTEATAPGGTGGNDAVAVTLAQGKDIHEDEIKIAFITLSTAVISCVMYDRVFEEQLSIYPNISYEVFDSMYDVGNQITFLGEAITQGYDAVIMECLDAEACNAAIAEVEAAGIPVLTLNVGASGLHTFHIQGDAYSSGELAAKELSKASGGKGTVVVLDCPAEQKAVAHMGTGFTDYIKNNTDIEILEEVSIANWSQEQANTAMRDLLTKYDDIDMVYGATDDIAMGALQAIEVSGRAEDGIMVFGNTGYPTGLEAVRDGRMFGTCFQDFYLQFSTILSMALYFISTGTTAVTAGYTETPVVDCVLLPCTAENVESIMAYSRWYD